MLPIFMFAAGFPALLCVYPSLSASSCFFFCELRLSNAAPATWTVCCLRPAALVFSFALREALVKSTRNNWQLWLPFLLTYAALLLPSSASSSSSSFIRCLFCWLLIAAFYNSPWLELLRLPSCCLLTLLFLLLLLPFRTRPSFGVGVEVGVSHSVSMLRHCH